MSRRVSVIVVVLLLIEFLDELVIGTRQATLPLIRSELNLSYAQMGLLLSLPVFLGSIIESVAGILGDIWKRHAMVMICGGVFAAAVTLIALGQSFPIALLGFILFVPASGALVGLAQATLIDTNHERIEQNMARWTFAGSIGATAGPIALGGFLWLGLSWRGLFLVFTLITVVIILFVRRAAFPVPHERTHHTTTFRQGLTNTVKAIRRMEILRWLGLLQISELMMDILLGFVALYFVDVAKVDPETAALAISIWSIAALLGDFLVIPLLENIPGIPYLRISAVLEAVFFTLFLLVPGIYSKIILLGLLGFFRAGWYPILKAQLYMVMPGQSGTVMTLNTLGGLFRSLLPLGLGMVAQQVGLYSAMWLLLLGPALLLIGLPLASTIRVPVIDKRRTLVMQAIILDEA